MPEVIARSGHAYQIVERWMPRHLALFDEHEALGDFAQQVELPALLRMQANEQQPVAARAAFEKIAT